MRVIDIRERTVPISRYADLAIPSGDLNTTVVAIVTDLRRDGEPIVDCGFSSIGRFGPPQKQWESALRLELRYMSSFIQAQLSCHRRSNRLCGIKSQEPAHDRDDSVCPFGAQS